jgi:hypothetical protein
MHLLESGLKEFGFKKNEIKGAVLALWSPR